MRTAGNDNLLNGAWMSRLFLSGERRYRMRHSASSDTKVSSNRTAQGRANSARSKWFVN